MFGLAFQIFSFFYIVMLTIIFFSKKRVNTIENKIFSVLIITNFVGLILDIISTSLALNNQVGFILILSSKLYLLYLITWISLLTLYIFVISLKEEIYKPFIKKYYKMMIAIFVFAIGVVLILPLYNYIDGNIVYTYGPSAISSYVFSAICIICWIICMVKNLKQLKSKKYIPMFAYLSIGLLATGIQATNPSILIITAMETFITFLMYFTIENPDVKMIQELQIARDQADKANRAKTDFLSNMSHEIRTPLNAIVGFSDCIMNANTLEEAKENAQDIVNASATLLEIVNSILDISKIEAGKLEIINSSYKAPEVFTELAKLIIPKMSEKGLDFSYYIAPDLPRQLYGDHSNIKKIITNLLSNACKYTDKGFVRYEVNCVKNMDTCKLIISVEDSGRGIKQENIDKLFNKFQRLEEDRNTTVEGTGLGLAITKQLIELMGGKIIVHTVYKEGSKFTVILNQRIEKKTEEPQIRKRTTLDLSGEKILIVDDNALNLKVATKLLQQYHATEIECVESGFSCLEKIQEGKTYDVILLDDMMPKMSGVETLKKLKEIPSFKTPVIALTANAINGMKEKYLRDGFDNYLAKPIDKEQLIQIMNEVLEKAPTEQLEIPSQTKEEIETLLPEETTIEDYLKQKGVNLEKSLEFLGDMEMYRMTAEDFLNEIDAKWKRIQKYKEEKDLENYAIEVHSLKSDAKYLGLTQLAEISYEHEIKSKEKDEDYIKRHFLELENAYQKSLEIEKEFLKKVKKKENS